MKATQLSLQETVSADYVKEIYKEYIYDSVHM